MPEKVGDHDSVAGLGLRFEAELDVATVAAPIVLFCQNFAVGVLDPDHGVQGRTEPAGLDSDLDFLVLGQFQGVGVFLAWLIKTTGKAGGNGKPAGRPGRRRHFSQRRQVNHGQLDLAWPLLAPGHRMAGAERRVDLEGRRAVRQIHADGLQVGSRLLPMDKGQGQDGLQVSPGGEGEAVDVGVAPGQVDRAIGRGGKGEDANQVGALGGGLKDRRLGRGRAHRRSGRARAPGGETTCRTPSMGEPSYWAARAATRVWPVVS